jgi:hypothetical protein
MNKAIPKAIVVINRVVSFLFFVLDAESIFALLALYFHLSLFEIVFNFGKLILACCLTFFMLSLI